MLRCRRWFTAPAMLAAAVLLLCCGEAGDASEKEDALALHWRYLNTQSRELLPDDIREKAAKSPYAEKYLLYFFIYTQAYYDEKGKTFLRSIVFSSSPFAGWAAKALLALGEADFIDYHIEIVRRHCGDEKLSMDAFVSWGMLYYLLDLKKVSGMPDPFHQIFSLSAAEKLALVDRIATIAKEKIPNLIEAAAAERDQERQRWDKDFEGQLKAWEEANRSGADAANAAGEFLKTMKQ